MLLSVDVPIFSVTLRINNCQDLIDHIDKNHSKCASTKAKLLQLIGKFLINLLEFVPCFS